MILAELEIEDYKQFHGVHRFVPPPEGIVGLIGPNGAGKTTLFEAIEWCLYNPREIVAEEIPTRGRAARPRVKVVLHDVHEDVRYVIERTLKRGVANAEIYREDAPDSRIVQGSRQVSEYVARRLIGLDHRAFVSTFFTRQKELTFFGNLKETERRREVGRLLGMETIRKAQQLIAEDRRAASAEAAALALQHRELSADRDFAAETAQAEAAIAARAAELVEAENNLAAASAALVEARDRLTRLQDLERRHGEVRRQLERVAGDERAAAERRDAASRALARLDEAAATRAALLQSAQEEPALAEIVRAHEAERERHLQAEQWRASAARAAQELASLGQRLAATVAGANATEIAGWSWRLEDAADPVAGASRLIAVVESLDAAGAAARAADLKFCFDLVQSRNQAEARLKHYQDHLAGLEEWQRELLAAGDPRADLEAARQGRETALQAMQTAIAMAQHNRDTLAQLEPIIASLRSQRFEDRCPTCGRPFSPEEAAITVAALEDRVEALRDQVAHWEEQGRQEKQRAQAYEQERQDAERRLDELTALTGRIEQGRPIVEEQDRLWRQAARACEEAIASRGLDGEPAPEAVVAAEAYAALLDRVARTLGILCQLKERAEALVAERTTAEAALAALGPIAYDPAAHEEAERRLAEARASLARIAQIDESLAYRPHHEADLAEAIATLHRLAEERLRLAEAEAALGFDPAALAAAAAAESAALAAERMALEVRGARQEAHREAVAALDRLRAEHAHIARLAERADARQREADLLDQMYREFTHFEQYVARRMTPRLAEHTSELVEAVTEGKYDRVEFTDNYGLEVYDGAEEHFPIEQFSGGERDVIALCARLALSRLIGDQAHNPPGFLVLDEVFGALDRERRAQVLETLGALTGTADAFHQLFIISHVDDIRTSPIFHEIWRVIETADGISRLENLTQTGGIEDV